MRRSLLLFTSLLTVLLLASPVYPADIRLSSRCTLADAIIAANNDRAEGDCPAGRGADTITLTQDITLRAELPAITSDITIEGEGYAISGDHRYRIFYNVGGALTIHDLTMTKGYVEGDLIYNADDTLKATTAQPFGGAIVNWQGTLTISNGSFSGNSAEVGGAIYNYEGKLSINDSSFSDNSAEWGGGAIHNDGELSISDSNFSDNSADNSGGAIAHAGDGTLSIRDSSFNGNSAEYSGAIHNCEGTLSISDSVFSDNSAEEEGGAVLNCEDGVLSISNSAFIRNSAGRSGGAVLNWEDGELNIVSSSFSGNSAGRSGGAIYNWEGGLLNIVSSSFSGNSANRSGGAIYNWEGGILSIINSIIVGRGRDACRSSNGLKQNIGNFIQDGSCSPAFKGDPKLGALVMPEDGSPAYFPLLAGSRAIDAADDDYCAATDQIGAIRPQGAGCDIGAIEYAAP